MSGISDKNIRSEKEKQLPKGWEWKKLGEVCLFENGDRGKNYPSKSKYVVKGIPFVNAGHLNNGRLSFENINFISDETFNLLSRGKFNKDDLLFCLRGSLGKYALIEEDIYGAVASSLVIVRTNKNLSNKYLAYYFDSNLCKLFINKLKGGAAQPNLGASDLKKFLIPIPPLSEQQKIVNILDQAFADIQKAQANIEQNIINAKELFQSKLNEIFEQRGEGWEEKSLGEIGIVSMCKRIFKKETSKEGEIPFYKIGTFGKTPNAFISKTLYDEYKSKYSFPKKGDILLSASGTIGRRVVYNGEPAYFQDSNIVWIDNNENVVSNLYLYYFYGVCDWQPSRGATISRLYNNDLRRIKIRFPKLEQQKELVDLMGKLKKDTLSIKNYYIQKLQNLEELKKSLLEQAFLGKL